MCSASGSFPEIPHHPESSSAASRGPGEGLLRPLLPVVRLISVPRLPIVFGFQPRAEQRWSKQAPSCGSCRPERGRLRPRPRKCVFTAFCSSWRFCSQKQELTLSEWPFPVFYSLSFKIPREARIKVGTAPTPDPWPKRQEVMHPCAGDHPRRVRLTSRHT